MQKVLLFLLFFSPFISSAQVEPEQVDPVEIQLSSAAPSCGLVRIRCCSPQMAQSSPLVIINGYVADGDWMKSIAPRSIKSLTVLKNEAALAIYGARAAAGVIIIQIKGQFNLSPDYTLTPDEIPANLFTLYEQHNFGGERTVQYLLNGKKRKLRRLLKMNTEKIQYVRVYTGGMKSAQLGFSAGSIVVNVITKQPCFASTLGSQP